MKKSPFPIRFVAWLSSLSLIAGMLLPGPVRAAATITVTSTANIIANDGLCTLREAIIAANTDTAYNGCPAGNGGDTIVLQAGATYTLDVVDNTDYGPNGLPSVTTPITITGQGATIARDSSAPNFRLLYVSPTGSLTLEGLTLRNGRAQGGAGAPSGNGGGGGGAGLGGAIFNRGTLVLRASTLMQNEAIGGAGGWGCHANPVTGGGSGGGGGGGLGGDGGHGHNYYPADVDYGGGGGGGMGGRGGDGGDGGGGGGGISGQGGLGGYNTAGGNGLPTGGGGGGGDDGYGGGAGSTGGGNGGSGSGSKNGANGSNGGGGGGGASGRAFSYSGGNGGSGGVGGGGGGGGVCYPSIFSEQGGAGGAGGIGGGGGGGGHCNDRGGVGGAGNWGGGGGGGGGSYYGVGGNGGAGGFGGGGGGGGDGSPTVGRGGAGGFGAGSGSDSLGHQIGGSGGGGAGMGGAIFNYAGTVVIVNSTLSGNTAQGGAGGNNGACEGPGIAAKGGDGLGGAIFNEGGNVTLLASTVAGNSVIAGAGGVGYDGSADGSPGAAQAGGLYNHASGSLTARNTILAGSVGGQDCRNDGGTVIAPASDRNLIASHTGCGTPALSDDPQLGVLEGNPPLHPLLPNSPALDAGLCLPEALTDQRGVARPQGAACDIGAYEYVYPGLLLTKSAVPTVADYHGAVTYTLTLSNTSAVTATGVWLTDTLPGSVTFAHWVERPAGANETGGVVTWTGSVAGLEAVTLTFVVTHTGVYGEVVTNTAGYGHPGGGGNASAEFRVRGGPVALVTPSALDFGPQVVGSAAPPQTVALTNTGESPLSVLDVATSGDFTSVPACPATLLPDEGCTVAVTFQPTAVGARTGVLTITTDALSSPNTVALAGTGIVPGLSLTKTALPTVADYHGTVTYTLTLSNASAVTATGVWLTDTLPGSVTFARWVERPAGANETGGVVTWTGSVAGLEAVTLTFVVTHTGVYGEVVTNTAGYGHPGGGGNASAEFRVRGGPVALVTPSALDFGPQMVGSPAPPQTVALTNTGESPLSVLDVATSGDFTSVPACPATLLPDEGCTVAVTFQPTAVGARTGVLTITTDALSSPNTVALSGVGAEPVLVIDKVVSPTLLVPLHGFIAYAIYLENVGVVEITDLRLTDTLPVNVTFSRWLIPPPPGAALAEGVVTWQGNLPAGAEPLILAFEVQHAGGYGEIITNTAYYHHARADGNDTAVCTVVPNTPPVIEEGDLITLTMEEDSPPLKVTLHATDTDTLTWSPGTPPLHGLASVEGSGLSQTATYTPAVNYNGLDSFAVQVTDEYGGVDAITVTVLITPVNDAPTLAPIAPQTVSEGAALTFNVTASDPDGDPLTLSAADLPSGALLAGGVFSWTPGFDAAGVYTVTFTASDGALTDSAAVSITVRNVNRAPQLTSLAPQTVNEGDLLTFTVAASDPDGDPLTLSADNLPTGALLAGGVFSWTPGYDAAGVYTITLVASDGVLSDTLPVSITVVEASPPQHVLYLPLVVRNHPPPPRVLLGPFPAVPVQPATTQGMVFYRAGLTLTGTLPAGGRFYFSGTPDRVRAVVVDDRLALARGGQDLLVYTFSTASTSPQAAVVEIPRAVMESIVAGGVALEYRDVFGALISADALWVIWVAEN